MDAEQIKSVDNSTLCRVQVSMYGNAIMAGEAQRRGLNCDQIVRAENAKRNQELLGGTLAGSDAGISAPIQNDSSPSCSGISIVEAGQARYSGMIPGVYLDVSNTTGDRKWIQADVKYTEETHTALQDTQEEWWETTQALQTREAGRSRFWVRQTPGQPVSNFKVVLVKVIGCGFVTKTRPTRKFSWHWLAFMRANAWSNSRFGRNPANGGAVS